jgi:hypothetical protein
MNNNKELTALNEHLEWLQKELQKVIDEGESESWVFAYRLSIKNAKSIIEKYKEVTNETIHTRTND